ncbi:MAG TPA: hypothetical protein VN030_07375 [Cellvibrio sp.]|nr:hypothetical protein [Cellvibrio sp.]
MSGKWFCDRHGVAMTTAMCIHLKESIDNGSRLNLHLVLEEISISHNVYMGNFLCDECSRVLGVERKVTVFFSPQFRKWDLDEFDEEDIEYEDIYKDINQKLTSKCNACFLEAYPESFDFKQVHKNDTVEIERVEAVKK